MISRERSMRLSAGLLPGRVNDRLVSGGSDLKFWLAQPRCPDIRETPLRCCSMNSSLQLWLLLLEPAGLKEFCMQQTFPDCGLHATVFFPPFGMFNLTVVFWPPCWKQWDSWGTLMTLFKKTCFLNWIWRLTASDEWNSSKWYLLFQPNQLFLNL